MRKISTVIVILFFSLLSKAQTYSWSGNSTIEALQTDTIPIEVSGLPDSITNSFGLSRICFGMSHSIKSNLVISLVSPDGQTVSLAENEGGASNLFSGTCVGLDGVPFELGNSPYTGTFLPVGDISSFNNGQNPNGTWKLLVRDNVTADTGSVHGVSITFINNPPQGHGLGQGNNLGPQGPFVRAGLVCPGGASGCDLLPDVTASAKEILSYHHEYPGRITVSNATPNIGYGPLEIYAIDSCFCNGVPSPCNVACADGGELQRIIRQRIYHKVPGTDTLGFFDRDAGAMTFHPEHGHLHVDNWANITLRKSTSDPNPINWPIIGTSVKQSYCLINLGVCSGNVGECVDNSGNPILTVPNNGFGFESGCGFNQGIYPGSYDVYSESLNEPIPLDNVCNGDYYIVSITDPDNVFLESDETNNVVAVPITLTQQYVTPIVTTSSQFICPTNDSVVLNVTNLSTVQWSNGLTGSSIVVKSPGTYTATSLCGVISTPIIVEALPTDAAPAVSISITEGSVPACSGTRLTFKATPSWEGNAPVYQWKADGINVGTNSNSFTSTTLTDGQRVTCELTSSINCFAATPVLSDSITVLVNPADSFNAVVTQTKGYNPFCLGDTVTFTATAIPGANPVYHWKVDGSDAGSNSPTFTSNSLQAGQVVSCIIDAVPGCGRSVTTGTASDTNNIRSNYGAAYPTWYGNGHDQYLVRASELQAAGLVAGAIDDISFITGANVGNPDSLIGYTIKLAAVTESSLTSTMLAPSFTTVFGPVTYRPVINDTNHHEFITPFVWDGSSNLLLDICFGNGVYGNGSYQNLITSPGFACGSIFQKDYSVPSPCDSTRAITISQRPYILFSNKTPKTVSSNEITIKKALPVYHFTGNGNWDNPANWANGDVPPLHLLSCSEIIIDPAQGGECLLNVQQVVIPGAKITVAAGKSFKVLGSLLIRE